MSRPNNIADLKRELRELHRKYRAAFGVTIPEADVEGAIDNFVAGLSTSSYSTGGVSDGGAIARYKSEYAAQHAAFRSMSLSEAEYIFSRKVEDGTEFLWPCENPEVSTFDSPLAPANGVFPEVQFID